MDRKRDNLNYVQKKNKNVYIQTLNKILIMYQRCLLFEFNCYKSFMTKAFYFPLINLKCEKTFG